MTSGWRHRSIRVRLTLWYTAALGAVLALYTGGVFAFLRHSLSADLDRGLADDREVAEQMLERTPADGVGWRAEPHDEDDDAAVGGRWLEVLRPDGTLLYERPSKIPADARVRRLSASYTVDGLPVVIQVARSEEPLDRELRTLLLVMGAAFPLAIAIAGMGGYVLARRALAPLGRMADRARTITAERLGERLPVENPGDELGRLAAVFNDAFARLERSFEQLRRFTADASHELRTPLTAMRSVGEVGLRERRDAVAYREIIGSMLEETDRLGRLVEGLLTLSRADGGNVLLRREDVDLAELVREVTGQLGVLAEEKRQSFAVDASGPVAAWVDRSVIRQALINLVDNAVKYTPPGGSVRISVRNGGPGPTVEVTDTGSGIPPEHHDRVFDRFYRIDKARSRDLGGAGLGLSIARWAVEAHGGRIDLNSVEGRGSTFRITLPQADGSKGALRAATVSRRKEES
jgi:heavy metal sensor kinase